MRLARTVRRLTGRDPKGRGSDTRWSNKNDLVKSTNSRYDCDNPFGSLDSLAMPEPGWTVKNNEPLVPYGLSPLDFGGVSFLASERM